MQEEKEQLETKSAKFKETDVDKAATDVADVWKELEKNSDEIEKYKVILRDVKCLFF